VPIFCASVVSAVDGEAQSLSSWKQEPGVAIKTTWTDKRLERLFARYNRRYWNGKLPAYSVRVDSTYRGGYCDKTKRTITLNVESMGSDREIRGALLHEMAHGATRVDHGTIWRAEMARLKSASAPTLTIDYRLDARLPRSFIIGLFEDAAQRSDGRWETVLRSLGYYCGYTDSRGRPRDAAAARFVVKAREAYRCARGKYLQRLSKTRQPSPTVSI
jgi:SprT-like family